MADHAPSLAAVCRQTLMFDLIAHVRSGAADLTNRQTAVLMLACWSEGPHTVRGLAATLGVQESAITRALDTLGGMGFLRRVRDEHDRRNIFIVPTDGGRDYLERVYG